MNGRKSIKNAWKISYIVVLLLPMIIMIMNHLQSIKVINDEIIEYNTNAVLNINNEINRTISTMYEIENYLRSSSIMLNLSNSQAADDIETRYELYRLTETLRLKMDFSYKNYIYFKNLDVVVSDSSIDSTKVYYNVYYKDVITYNEFDELLYQRSDKIKYVKDNEGNIVVTKKINDNVVLFFIVNNIYIQETIKDSNILEGGVFILSQGERILYSSDAEITSINPGEIKDKRNVRINGKKYIPCCFFESRMDYIFLIQSDYYMAKIDSIYISFIVATVISILCGIICIIIMLKINYRPIRNIMKKIGADFDDGHEYDAIDKFFEKNAKKTTEMQWQLKRNREILKLVHLERVLKRKNLFEEHYEDIFGEHDFESDNKCFTVAIMSVYDYGDYGNVNEEDVYDETEMRDFSNFSVQQIVDELMNENFKCITAIIDGDVVSVVNTDDKKEMAEIIKKAHSLVNKYCKVRFTSGIGCVSESIDNISESYIKAVEELYSNGFGGGNTVSLGSRRAGRDEYFYSESKAAEFTKLIMRGNYIQAENFMNNFFYTCVKEKGLSIGMLRCITYDMTADIVKVIMKNKDGNFDEETVSKVFANESFLGTQEYAKKLLKVACDMSDVNQMELTRVESIKKYIQENYMDVNLNTNAVAEQFGLVPSYVSKIFTEEYDMSILSYIATLRIEHAKKLLAETDMTIENIATKVGISNKVTFLRLFKKYEGITPGSFRAKGNL